MSRMSNISFNETLQRSLANEIHERYFNNQDMPGMMFLGVKAYLDDIHQNDNKIPLDGISMDMNWVNKQKSHERMVLASKQIRFRGGQIADRIKPGITHVVMDLENLERLQQLTDESKG